MTMHMRTKHDGRGGGEWRRVEGEVVVSADGWLRKGREVVVVVWGPSLPHIALGGTDGA